jgi:hypothetical protein
VLQKRTVAADRTLEQKISDAGPNNQRVEPVILTQARNLLVTHGIIQVLKRGRTPWFHLKGTPSDDVESRLSVVETLYLKTQDSMFTQRVGQALEIAVFKALIESGRDFLGNFLDLDDHNDSDLYKKTDPPLVISRKKIEKGLLDYIVFVPGGMGGIEIKNYRTWLYPDTTEIKELLWKCADIGAVPIFMARRIPFITFRLLNLSGCLVYQHYNQLYANADSALASSVRDKNLLGYHDVRVGNVPDKRMTRFVSEYLPDLVGEARPTFEKFRELHRAYGKGELSYGVWVRKILEGNGVWPLESDAGSEGPDISQIE